MAVIDLVKWNGDHNLLAWKFPSEELSTWTQLIVNETQEAFLVKEGVYQGPFGAGRHTLATSNIPLLAPLIGAPFDGKTPFTAEVWYVNKLTKLDMKWGTSDPIQLEDPKYRVMIPVRSYGQYGIRIIESKRFLLKLVGTVKAFDANTLETYFRGILITKIKSLIAHEIVKNQQSILEISPQLAAMSDVVKLSLSQQMLEYGVELTQFNIQSINTPENDPTVASLKAALAKRTEMNLLGTNYQQLRSFDVLQTAASNEGGGNDAMGAGMGLSMGVGVGNILSQMMPQMHTMQQTQVKQQSHEKINGLLDTCPRCQTPNTHGARYCSECGNHMVSSYGSGPLVSCRHCKVTIPGGSKFCPECGQNLLVTCKQCGHDLRGNEKFCPDCGQQQ